jgi:L-asparaginase
MKTKSKNWSIHSVVLSSLILFSSTSVWAAKGKEVKAAPVKTTAQAENNKKAGEKARIKILATGGTIAGASKSATDYGYKAGAFDINTLIDAVPTMKDIADLSGEQVANIGSQDMNDEVWLKLVKRINEVLKSKDVDGVVITHGTDTMEETAYFLNLAVKSDKPVVLVGSMRPADAISADGPANLYNAVAVASSKEAKGRGVLVVMNDQIHLARNIEKSNTTNVAAFTDNERAAAGVVNTGKIVWYEPSTKKHTAKSEFNVDKLDKLPKVDIVYAYANMDATLIDAAAKSGAKGIVVAGVGDGNMTKPALDALEKFQGEGGLVIRSTRLPTGVVLRNNEVDDDKMGFVASGEFNPEKSRVLAQMALTTKEGKDPKKVQEMFYTY